MPDILVRNLSDATLEVLKQRAQQHHRSLQQEVLTILEGVARDTERQVKAAQIAMAIRERLAQTGRTFGESTALVREDRAR